jgi:hypothetical protein
VKYEFQQAFDLIERVAAVPSFTSFEDRLHPLIRKIAEPLDGVRVEKPEGNNLIVHASGRSGAPVVALTAHCDKINHFGENPPDALPVTRDGNKLTGQMDDSVGVGILLHLLLESRKRDFPPLMFLFSEVEESWGLRKHPHLLLNQGKGLYPRIGAERIAQRLIDSDSIPSVALTIDTTPKFKGEPGIALYCDHWEKNGIVPSHALLHATAKLRDKLLSLEPEVLVTNNTNDYLKYGELFNADPNRPVPCVAIEPSIYPYHQEGESVFLSDIERVVEIVAEFLGDGH